MGLFDSKTKEDKKSEKLQKVMQRYHLEDCSPELAPQVQEIGLALMGNKALEFGQLLQGNSVDSVKMSYLDAIVKQNFMIIKLLDQISNK